MKILSLCFCNDYFYPHANLLVDKKLNLDVLELDLKIGSNYDLIFAAPPCDQFTKANNGHWEEYPDYFVKVAKKCFDICINSGNSWVLENPPGRIEKFEPGLTKFRTITFQDYYTNKEYVLYSNVLLTSMQIKRYGKKPIHAWDKSIREMWTAGLVEMIKQNFNL